jgi:anti-sigma regulatory factor (Ser/Thr protein kinase)
MSASVFSPPHSLHAFEAALVKDPSSVRLARRFVREWYRHWRLPQDVIDAGELVTSELVTNGLKAKGHKIIVRFRWAHPAAYVEVWDADPNPPIPQQADLAALGGRGLVLVQAYAARWNYYPSEGGKVVWAELAAYPVQEAADVSTAP